MSTSITVSEARSSLPKILERVAAGEEVSLTRHGDVVAVIVRPDRLRSRRAETLFALATELHDALEVARRTPFEDRPGLSKEYADELIAEIQEGRSSRERDRGRV